MAFRLKSTLVELKFEDNPELNEMEIMVKSDVTLNTLFKLQIEMGSGEVERIQTGFHLFATQVLSSWDVTLDDGTPVPADEEGFGMLPFELAQKILLQWITDAQNPGEESRLTQNGTSPSGAELTKMVSQ